MPKGDRRQSFRFNVRFDVDLRGRSGGVYPPSGLQVELKREVDNGFVIGFGFENVCSDEKSGNCRFVSQSGGPSIGPLSRD